MDERFQTGVEGLDDILNGGLPPQCMYLVQGDPGSGKTTRVPPALTIASGAAVEIETLSHQGLTTSQEPEKFFAASGWDRTHDPWIDSPMLYPLI